jgi:flagellin
MFSTFAAPDSKLKPDTRERSTMSLGILNNISAIYAQNYLSQSQGNLQNTLRQLASGSRINSGADDAAGLSLADGLAANHAALTQSATNASQGVGLLQVADGALSQVTNLLNRAVTLSTEASNGTLNAAQQASANLEFQSIVGEIATIGSTTTYNNNTVFGSTVSIVTGDGSAAGSFTDKLTFAPLTNASIGENTAGVITAAGGSISYVPGAGATLAANNLTSAANAQTALTAVFSAVQDVAQQRGYIGSQINTLQAASSVESTQGENILSAENSIRATDFGQASSNLSKYQILSQTGISALAQANSVQQQVLKLLQ